MQKAKLIALIVVTMLLLVIVLQNTESVETRILFFPPIIMPRAAMLFGSLLVGFVIGVLMAGRFLSKRK